jgi:hypothetical protein
LVPFHHNLENTPVTPVLDGVLRRLPARGAQGGAACFTGAFHNFVPPVIIVALGPTNFGIKGFSAGRDAACLKAFVWALPV